MKFSCRNSDIQTPLTRKILLTLRNDLYRRVSLVEYYQNPLTRVHLIFWNKTPHPRVSGCAWCVDFIQIRFGNASLEIAWTMLVFFYFNMEQEDDPWLVFINLEHIKALKILFYSSNFISSFKYYIFIMESN